MNGRELAIFVACLLCALSAILFFARGGKHGPAARRLDAMLVALNDPALDATTRAELLRALARDAGGFGGWLWEKLRNPTLWRVLWFSTGWTLLVLAGTAVATEAMSITNWGAAGPIFLTGVGFAMVTLPLAWREVSRRERLAAEQR